MTFRFNVACDYGRSIYSRVNQSVINVNAIEVHFENNHARTAVTSCSIFKCTNMCNSSCLHKSVLVHDELNKHITISPKELVLYT